MSDTLQVRHLEECAGTNAYMKAYAGDFSPVGAVFTTNQTAGRGRLGRSWANAAGLALYYTAAIDMPLAQPETLPQLSSLIVLQAIQEKYGIACRIKWPNDLLAGGKKLAGILCESTEHQGRRIWISGIGINLAQPQAYFEEARLPHGTSLRLAGAKVDPEADAAALAARMTALFAAAMPDFSAQGFAPLRPAYCAACVNLGRSVTFPTEGGEGRGTAEDIDTEGRLVVRTAQGVRAVFTGEVSVSGIYGNL